jgi:hypothetical protein
MRTIQYVVTALLLTRMVFAGFTGAPNRLFSWPMFAFGGSVQLTGTGAIDGRQEELKLLDLLIPGDVTFDKGSIPMVIDWFAEHYDHAEGVFTVLDEQGLTTYPFTVTRDRAAAA